MSNRHSSSNCCPTPPPSPFSCPKVSGCINSQLKKIGNEEANDLPNFCSAVIVCVNNYFKSLPGYDETGDIFLSFSDNILEWQEVTEGGGGSSEAGDGLFKLSDTIYLGQPIGQAGDPAQFLEDREISLGDYSLTFNGDTNSLPSAAKGSITIGMASSTILGVPAVLPQIVTHTSGFSSTKHVFDIPATTGIKNFGNVEYYGTTTTPGDRFLGVSGYHYQDFGGGLGMHYFLFDMTGTTTSYVAIECGGSHFGNSHANWISDGSTHFGLAGNQKTVFGTALAAASILGFVHIKASTSSTSSLHIEPSATRASSPSNGNIWIDNTVGAAQHLYAKLDGTIYQIDQQAGGSGLTVGSTTIASGTTTRLLFDDGAILGEDAGLTYSKTTKNLIITGTNGSLTAGPKMSLMFTGDANDALSFFMFTQSNMALSLASYFDGANWISSSLSGNFLLYNNSGDLQIQVGSGNTAGSSFSPTKVWGIKAASGNVTQPFGSYALGSGSDATDKLEVTGNIALTTAGNKLKIATGSNASIGVSGALSSGTITISTTAVTSSSKIFLTHATSAGTLGILSVGTIVNGTSFVINSSNAADTSTINWLIIN